MNISTAFTGSKECIPREAYQYGRDQQGYNSDIEWEVYAASVDMLDKIAEALQVQPCELITRGLIR